MSLLENIKAPSDIKSFDEEKLKTLCDEIREELVNTVSKTGGHLASNLGVVELTVAMHKVFNSPQDQFVFDVGHQCYTHKLLTGRYNRFSTLRTENGISGFTRRSESEHDIFSSGHSSVSVSAANGLAKAKALKNEKGKVVAVIGDGALTGGMVYEAFNTVARHNNNLIVILNDNNMSISQNVGSVAKLLTDVRTTPEYAVFKTNVEKTLLKIPLVGERIAHCISVMKNLIKKRVYGSNFFDEFGFDYYGPIDGHDLPKLIEALTMAKVHNKSVLLHVNTTKGKGYDFAEKNPTQFHGIGKFNIETGEPIPSGETYSSTFGKLMCEFSEKDSRICALTAAMAEGTGLSKYSAEFKNRCFDVGIAEPHAVTFAAGLARNKMIPVFAVYSTFLQRCYDQVIHDCAMQELRVVFAIDRAGFVGEDGESHQGVFDVAFLNTVPGMTIFSPSSFEEMRNAFYLSFYKEKNLVAVRYPRGGQRELPDDYSFNGEDYQIYGNENAKYAIVTYGRLFSNACKAKKRLYDEKGIDVKILKLNKIKPISDACVKTVLDCDKIWFYEEGIKTGGVGEHFACMLLSDGFKGSYKHIAVTDCFIKQASVERQMLFYKMDAESMFNEVSNGEENQA